jgi:hypothetical protein
MRVEQITGFGMCESLRRMRVELTELDSLGRAALGGVKYPCGS